MLVTYCVTLGVSPVMFGKVLKAPCIAAALGQTQLEHRKGATIIFSTEVSSFTPSLHTFTLQTSYVHRCNTCVHTEHGQTMFVIAVATAVPTQQYSIQIQPGYCSQKSLQVYAASRVQPAACRSV